MITDTISRDYVAPIIIGETIHEFVSAAFGKALKERGHGYLEFDTHLLPVLSEHYTIAPRARDNIAEGLMMFIGQSLTLDAFSSPARLIKNKTSFVLHMAGMISILVDTGRFRPR